MIAAISALTLLVPGSLADDEHHVYEVRAPTATGLYRIRPSLSVVNAWAIGQLKFAAVFDADGAPLSCELLRNNSFQEPHKRYALDGRWIEDAEAIKQSPLQGFKFKSVWKLDIPEGATEESAVWLLVAARSTTSDPGSVQVIETWPHPGQNDAFPNAYLRNLQPNSPPVVLVPLGTTSIPDGRRLTGELRFSRSSSELTIDRVTLETQIRRPWVEEVVGGPGWIMFVGNGRPPYRLQIASAGSTCRFLPSEYSSSPVQDPDWPPEVTVTSELVDAMRLGESPNAWEEYSEHAHAERARGAWRIWAGLVALLFCIAIAIAWLGESKPSRPWNRE